MSANLARRFEDCAAHWPDRPVLLRGEQSLTWARLDRGACAIAAVLAARGVVPGDRVAIELDDPMAVTIALIGVLKTGASATPLNPRLASGERDNILADLGPRTIIRELVDDDAEFESRAVDGQQSAFVLYTSGSTGQAKGVMLSHDATAMALAHWRGPVMALSEGDCVLSVLPPAHSFGIFGSILAPLSAGAAVVLLERFTPEAVLALIARHRITVFPGVATMFQRLLDHPQLPEADLSSLRHAVSGAAPCAWELAEAWRAATGARIIRGYGMTELFRPISFSANDDRDQPDAIGRAITGVDLRTVGDDGNDVAAGETGELTIRSPARMTGYLNRPDETAAVLDGDWFMTGDLASISPDGFVSIVGRKKDVIVRGGYSIAAGEIETVLTAHPDIVEAAVIGVPDRELGEEIAAFVAPRHRPSSLTPDDIVAHCRSRLASYKIPRQIHIRDELPKGPTGKILKARLLD